MKQKVSEHLRNADKFIKEKRYNDALDQVTSVLAIDPKNPYARAYQERIRDLLEESNLSLTGNKETKNSSESKTEPAEPSPSATPAPPIQSHRLSFAIREGYYSMLREIWKDGIITPEEEEHLREMRTSLGITPEMDEQLRREARTSLLFNDIKVSIKTGKKNFDQFFSKYKFSEEEIETLQPQIEKLMKALDSKGSVMLLDDDRNFLRLVEKILEKNGYYSFPASSVEDGLIILETLTPNIVLCDINFGKSKMNGFQFYENFRNMDEFKHVPFIFISAFSQETMVQTGKKLGVDDYLFKPIQPDLLIATIEGKLRRAHELQGS